MAVRGHSGPANRGRGVFYGLAVAGHPQPASTAVPNLRKKGDLMVDEFDWPDVELKRVDVQECCRWSGLRDVSPVFSREPYGDWCFIFRECCDEDSALEWKSSGFVRCKPEELIDVCVRLERATGLANKRFRGVLAGVLVNQTRQARDLITLECLLSVSDNGDGYLCTFAGV